MSTQSKSTPEAMSARRVTIYMDSPQERDVIRKLAFDHRTSESTMARELVREALVSRGLLKEKA